jgi:hypothetical protein
MEQHVRRVGPENAQVISGSQRRVESGALTESHEESASTGHDAPNGGSASKSSPRRLVLLTVIMVGFAVLTWGPSLVSRNAQAIFIPAWLTLTISTVVISMWFAKYLLTAEKNRDSETAPQGAPAHSH